MKYKIYLLLSLTIIIFNWATSSAQIIGTAKSPDGNLKMELNLDDSGSLSYTIKLKGEAFLENSPLGLQTSMGDFSKDLDFISGDTSAISENYKLDRAKVSSVDYQANELISSFTNKNRDTLKLIFRVSYDDVAFSYHLSGGKDQTSVTIEKENSGFNLPNYATTYITPQALPMTGWMNTKPSYEEEYTLNEKMGQPSLNGVGYTFPALFKLAEKGWVLISETGVHGQYAGSRLGEGSSAGLYLLEFPQEGENNGIGEVSPSMALPAQTPWRTITVGTSLKPIVESTVAFDVVKPLYEATENYVMGRAAWSWIVWQDGSINYDDQVKYIDLASNLNFEYVLIDNWWDRNIGRDKMEELVKYAKSRNVDIILWYNSNGYWNNAPQTPQDRMNFSYSRKTEMKWMHDIGVKGIKVDFFGGDKQQTMQLYEDILTDANEYGLGVTFHGCTLPRGWERMFPNYVTSEAVLASENLVFRQDALNKHALNATILPFTRNAVGAMDFAPVFLNERLSRDQKEGTIRTTTDVFELATAILYFSPIQHFGLTPDNLQEQPDFILKFLKNVPTTWDETVYIAGEPEKYIVLGRRKGESWYIAAVNAEKKSKKIEIDLPMISGKRLQMIYDKNIKESAKKMVQIPKNGKLKLELQPEGGVLLVSEN